MSNKKYEWVLTGKDKDDLKCNMGDDMLRVERLDKGVWWFAVYVGDKTYMSGEMFPHVGSKESAKYFAESIYQLVKEVQPSLTINGIKAIAMAAFNYGYLTKMDDAAFEKWFSEFVEKDFPVQPSLKEDEQEYNRGYGDGYRDATREAKEEIREHYHPNRGNY